MQGKAVVGHHPIHPMLIPFPIAYWIGSGVADIIYGVTKDDFWNRKAREQMTSGIATALTAAIPGLVDYLTAPMSPSARRTSTLHLATNLGITGLFTANRALRRNAPEGHRPAGYVLSAVALGALLYSGWLGGTMVYEYHVGVEDPAHDLAEQPESVRQALRQAA